MDITFLLELGGLFLTLVILLYLIFGDNALFRLVTYSFIGVAAGYVAVLVIFQVLLPRLSILVVSQEPLLVIIGLIQIILGLMLFLKLWNRTSFLGALPMAMLVGIGAAVTVGGSVFGTLFGQIGGTIGLFDMQKGGDPLMRLLEGSFVLVGTISTLAYFQFNVRSKSPLPEQEAKIRRAPILEVLAVIGQGFIGITLGAMFAGVFTAAVTALIERIGAFFDFASRYIY
ncbi:MAG: hypothetical protein IH586_13170 [Anaerolineaceae bacterium]|nr:hypothetical protein [Anaerolineaceae bacterium]